MPPCCSEACLAHYWNQYPVVVNNVHHSSYLIIRNHHAGSGKLSKTDIKVTVFSNVYRSFHVYQHVTSFSHMRGALVGRRTTAAGFHMQNMCDVGAKTLEYRSKYTHILNPTVREDIR